MRRGRSHITRGTFDHPTDVYRLYDAGSRLLYVGIGINGYARLDAHRRERSWWPDVRRVVMEQYGNRWTALYIEACAIRDDKPLHNVSHNEFTAESPHRCSSLDVIQRDEFEVA